MTAWARREYTGIAELRGPLMVVRGVDGVGWDEFAAIRMQTGDTRHGLVLEADRDLAVVQVLEGTDGMRLAGTRVTFSGTPLRTPVGANWLGRVCNGRGEPIDGGPPVTGEVAMPVRACPGYLYSDLASLYERCGRIRGLPGSVTVVPVLTMPAGDITHPVPDLTGYITEGQIVLSPDIHARGVYPPVDALSSLSRLMRHGAGPGRTRDDHLDVAAQTLAALAAARHASELAELLGATALSPLDRQYLELATAFEREFMNQGRTETRSLEESLSRAWKVLATLPRDQLTMLPARFLDVYLPSWR